MEEIRVFLSAFFIVFIIFGSLSFGVFCAIKLGKWSAKTTAKERRESFVGFWRKIWKKFYLFKNLRALAQFERIKQFQKLNKK